jgi:hypothetical protein
MLSNTTTKNPRMPPCIQAIYQRSARLAAPPHAGAEKNPFQWKPAGEMIILEALPVNKTEWIAARFFGMSFG